MMLLTARREIALGRTTKEGTGMTIADRIGAPLMPPVLSFEMFPPRTRNVAATVDARLDMLTGLRPDFISVTYGAAGSGPQQSREMVLGVLRRPQVAAVAHLTCVGRSEYELRAEILGMLRLGLRDILALRGDPPVDGPGAPPLPGPDCGGRGDAVARSGYPASAAQLVTLVRQVEAEARTMPHPLGGPLLARGERVSIGVAAYPASPSRPRDVELHLLAEKEEAGADFALTQVFHRAEEYLGLVADARAAGIALPILPGVLPYQDLRRLGRLEALSGVPTPADIAVRLDVDDADERRRRGARLTLDLAAAVLDGGAPGVHLYTFNQLHAVDELAALVRAVPVPRAPRELAGVSS